MQKRNNTLSECSHCSYNNNCNEILMYKHKLFLYHKVIFKFCIPQNCSEEKHS